MISELIEEYNVSYLSLFASVENSDGAVAEDLSIKLLTAFCYDTDGFLEFMLNQPENIIERSIILLSGAGFYNNLEKFESILADIESKTNNEGINKILSDIKNNIAYLKEMNNKAKSAPPITAPTPE